MEMIETEISFTGYLKRYGHLKFIDLSDPPLTKRPRYSPSVIPPLPDQNPIFTLKLSPILLKNNKRKRFTPKSSSSLSVEEITKQVFDGVVRKSSSWIKSEFLGRGSYGSVYLATSKKAKTKTTMAIKSAEISRASSLMDEERILTRLSSPFIVRCYGHEIAREETLFGGERTNYNLILEYCSGKSLFDLVNDNLGGLSEKDVKLLARDILYGLDYIHRANIIHCDIKPENIFLTPVENRIRPNGYAAKIGDFGHKRGTTRYMSPELIRHGIVDYAVDTWAFGCTVLEMLTGQQVWGEHSDLGSVDWDILIGQSCYLPYIPDWLSEEAQHFLSRCLKRDPASSCKMKYPTLYLVCVCGSFGK
ncbi:putative mitogen-activated protein kinase kinase kinase STE-STE11 family [Arabidopsis thaliana]